MAVNQPARHPWAAAIHAGADRPVVTGGGVVIDEMRVLTCCHVVMLDGQMRQEISVSLPTAGLKRERRFHVDYVEAIEVSDLAVIHLSEALGDQVEPAPLAWPTATALAGQTWWGFGLRGDLGIGDGVEGTLGWQKGFGLLGIGEWPAAFRTHNLDGAGIWSPTHHAVVGLAVHIPAQDSADLESAVLTLHQITTDFPELRLMDLSAWQDDEASQPGLPESDNQRSAHDDVRRHWHPKASGVLHSGHDLFQGRSNALVAISNWLERPRVDRRVLVVTGMPGSGKSAVLARIITTAGRRVHSGPAADTDPIKVTSRSVSCAVHAQAKGLLQVMQEIAQAAGLIPPLAAEDFYAQVVVPLTRRHERFNVIIDALDEASDPSEARAIIRSIIIPLCEESGHTQVVVGTRRSDAEGQLITALVRAAEIIDLDDVEFFDEEDVAKYVEAILRIEETAGLPNAYARSEVTSAVARRIAALSGRNFLVAGLVANHHRMHDLHVAVPGQITFDSRVNEVLGEYVNHLSRDCHFARAAMTCLAFAEGAGLTIGLWREAVMALGQDVSEHQLATLASNSAAAYLVESSEGDGERNYRLFHPALSEALLEARSFVKPRNLDEQRIVRAWTAVGDADGWTNVPAYLLRWLPRHAQRAHMVDSLLENDEFLLRGNRNAMLQAGQQSTSSKARARTRVLQLVHDAASAPPGERRSMLTVAQALHRADAGWNAAGQGPYEAVWAQANAPLAIPLISNAGAMTSLATFRASDLSLVAAGDEEGSIRIWNLATCVLEREYADVAFGDQTAVCAIETRAGPALAIAGKDDSIRLVDTETGEIVRVLAGHEGRVSCITAVTIGGVQQLVSGSHDGTVRIWEVAGGESRTIHAAGCWITAISVYEHEGKAVVSAGAVDGTVWLLDPANGTLQQTLVGHSDRVVGVCSVFVEGRRYLASASWDKTLRLWDPQVGAMLKSVERDTAFNAACALADVEGAQLATASIEGDIHIWDLRRCTATPLPAHEDRVTRMCQVQAGTHSLLVTAGEDGSVMRWDLSVVSAHRDSQFGIEAGSVKALCAMEYSGRQRVLSAGEHNRLDQWDLQTGFPSDQVELFEGGASAMCLSDSQGATLFAASQGRIHVWGVLKRRRHPDLGELPDAIHALAVAESHGRRRVISGGADGTVRIWDLDSAQNIGVMEGHADAVTSLAAFRDGGRPRVASGSVDTTIRVWDLEAHTEKFVLRGHTRAVTAIASFSYVDGGPKLLASGSEDATVRLWMHDAGEAIEVLEGHRGTVNAMSVWRQKRSVFLATASTDKTVRIWDLQQARCVLTIPTGYRCQSVIYSDGRLVVGLDVGLLAIAINDL